MKQMVSQQPTFKPDDPQSKHAQQLKSQALLVLTAMDRRDINEETAGAYHIAIREFRVDTVEQACQDFLSGNVEGVNKAFCPSPAELAAQCRKIQVPVDKFNRVWNPTKSQQLESRSAQHRRELAMEKAKTPEQKLEAINRIRRENGMPPFNPYRAGQRLIEEKEESPELKNTMQDTHDRFAGQAREALIKKLENGQ